MLLDVIYVHDCGPSEHWAQCSRKRVQQLKKTF